MANFLLRMYVFYWRINLILFLFVFTFTLSPKVVKAVEYNWSSSQVVDSSGNVGSFLSMDVDNSGKAHISYYDQTNDDLKYATNTSGSWVTQTVDTVGGYFPSLAVDNLNKTHISYSYTVSSINVLKYATNASGSWATQPVVNDINEQTSSLAVDTSNKAHISYLVLYGVYDEGSDTWTYYNQLKYVTNASGSWGVPQEVLTSDSIDVPSLALDSSNKAHISFYDSVYGLSYITNASGSWVAPPQTVDSFGYDPSIAVNSLGQAHISYDTGPSLKYATNALGSWVTQTVDNIGPSVGYPTSLALDSSTSKVYISYYDQYNANLKFATNASGAWVIQTLDSTGDVGQYSSLAFDENTKNVYISYYDATNGDLKYLFGQYVLEYIWNKSATPGNWSSAANWGDGSVPNSATNTDVKIDNETGTNSTVNLDMNATVSSLAISSGDTLNFNNGSSLTLNGNISNVGSMNLNSAGTATDLKIDAGTVTLSGGGILTLGNNSNNRILGVDSNETFINQSTIQGGGQVGANSLAIANQGTISANSSGVTMEVDPNSSGLTNTGTMRATSGGILKLQDGTFTNTSGTIEAQASSMVYLSSATVSGGTVQTVGSGEIKLSNSTISDGTMTNSSTGTIKSTSGTSTISSTLTNAGTLEANASTLAISGTTTSTGIAKATSGGTLNVNSNVSGSGGRWIADGGTININNGADVSTTGNIDILNSGQLKLVADAGNASITGNNLTIDTTGSLSVNSDVILDGSLSYQTTDTAKFTWSGSSLLRMNGGTGLTYTQFASWPTLEVGGTDMGTNAETHVGAAGGFSNNFDLTELVIGTGAHIKLVDTYNNDGAGGASEALYVDTLRFKDSTSIFNLKGLNLYYQSLALDGGSSINQIKFYEPNTFTNTTTLDLGSGYQITYDQVTAEGYTKVDAYNDASSFLSDSEVGFMLSSSMKEISLKDGADFDTTGGQGFTLRFPYDPAEIPAGFTESQLRLFHFMGPGDVRDITTWVDVTNNYVYGFADSMSPFGVGVQPEPSTILMLLLGLGGFAFRWMRRRS